MHTVSVCMCSEKKGRGGEGGLGGGGPHHRTGEKGESDRDPVPPDTNPTDHTHRAR